MDKETEQESIKSESANEVFRATFEKEVASIKKGAEGFVPEHQQFWFIELWFEKRELFKEFMGEAFFIGVMLAILEIVHRLILRTSLEPKQISLLSKTHFYMTFGSLVILSLGFIITLLKSLRGKTK